MQNPGLNFETSILNLIELLSEISGKKIKPQFQVKENPGTNRRVPDISKIKSIGYSPKISLEKGLKTTYDWYSKYYEKHPT